MGDEMVMRFAIFRHHIVLICQKIILEIHILGKMPPIPAVVYSLHKIVVHIFDVDQMNLICLFHSVIVRLGMKIYLSC